MIRPTSYLFSELPAMFDARLAVLGASADERKHRLSRTRGG
jgi:hypothetical protein